MAESVKRIYEAMFLVDSAWASGNWDEVLATINTVMGRANAEVIEIRKWDDRRLCYEIQGHKRGMYILIYFNANPSVISGMERDIKLNESIIRALILSAERIPQEIRDLPTPAMLGARDEEDSRTDRDDDDQDDQDDELTETEDAAFEVESSEVAEVEKTESQE